MAINDSDYQYDNASVILLWFNIFILLFNVKSEGQQSDIGV